MPRLARSATVADGKDTMAQDTAIASPLFDRLRESRIVFLGEEVTDESANRVCAELLLLAADSDDDIQLYINSPGGSVDAGFAIYDTMRFVRPDVATLVLGLAGSMGQFLLSSGSRGKRYALPNARVVMHQPHGGFGGTAADISIQAEQILSLKRIMAELTAEQTGQTVERILADGDRDRWFTAEEARDYGFVDAVIDSASQLRS